jgi:predicted AAA+ superfamily ATPase
VAYRPRIVDRDLRDHLDRLPAVAVDGPKAVGKTATAERVATSLLALDDPSEVDLLRVDPRRIERLGPPVLIDEWQKYPPVWDAVRRAVDRGAPAGSFVLTGSATPTAPTHTGAGRIVRMRMRPMSLAERALVPPTVSLADLLAGARPPVEGSSTVTLGDYAEEILRSGFPGIRERDARDRHDLLGGYVDSIVEHDFAELGHVVRRPAALRAWLTAFGAASSSVTAYGALLDAATPGLANKPAKTTTIGYRDTLERLWILDELPAWTGPRNHLASLTHAPKHHLADPALAARLLGVGAGALVDSPWPGGAVPRDGTLLGALFESLVTLGVRVYAEAAGATVAHLRTKRGEHEVDLVVVRDDGRVLALEVKLARTATDADVTHLRWLRERLGDDVLDAAVITTGDVAYRRPDGIAVVPAALLGP